MVRNLFMGRNRLKLWDTKSNTTSKLKPCTLWRERNSRCFEDKERSISDLKLFFFRIVMDWLVALRNQSFLSFLDFLDSCNFCSWLFDPLSTPCVLGCSPFLISINLLLIKKIKINLFPLCWWFHMLCKYYCSISQCDIVSIQFLTNEWCYWSYPAGNLVTCQFSSTDLCARYTWVRSLSAFNALNFFKLQAPVSHRGR